MSQTRLMTSVVTTAAQISSGAVLTLAGKTQTTKSGLEVVPDLIRLVATTIGRSSMLTHEDEVVLESLLCRLIRRYGTMRSALESIASSRRRHSLACAEKAAAWVQVMVVSPSAIEVTMRRHGWLTAAIKTWVEERSGTLSQVLSGYLSWLDGPLTDFDDTSPSLPWERLQSVERKHVIPVGDGSGFGLEAVGSSTAGVEAAREGSSVIPFDAIPGARVGMQDSGGSGHALEEALPAAKRFACADVELIWRTVFEDKRPMEQAGDREFTAEQQAALERLEAGHEPLGCAVAMIARRSFGDADSIIPHLEGRVDTHHLAMLRGHRYDLEGRYDEAAEMFRIGCAESGDAASQRALAVALLRGQRGSKRTRVGEAIRRLREVLRTTPEGSLEWARTSALLGTSCMQSSLGDRAANLDEAIERIEDALTVLNQEDHPAWWAETRYLEALALLERRAGGEAAIERAVEALESAASVWTRERDPGHWASVQACLGHAWERLAQARHGGAGQECLEHAITAMQRALQVRTRERHPHAWAKLQFSLGRAWAHYLDGDRRQNIERAIALHTAALEVWSRDNRSAEWSAAQNALGQAWSSMPTTDPRERQLNLRRAVSCYRSAIKERGARESPHEWAMAHHHLAAALVQIEEGEDGLSVRNAAVEAARSCEAALRVRTREASPLDWGRTQFVLGQAVLRASGTSPAPGHANALRAFRAASEIFSANDHPQEHQLIAAQIARMNALLESSSNGQ